MNNFDEELYEHLREMARKDGSFHDILDFLIKEQKFDNKSRIYFIRTLKEAFNLKMRDAMVIGAWDYFYDGTRSIDNLEMEIGPLIKAALKNT